MTGHEVSRLAPFYPVYYKQRRLYIIKRDTRIKKKAYELEEVKQREEEEDGDEEGATEKRM